MQTFFDFGTVALTVDPVFGLCVFAEPGNWVPFSEGSPEEKDWVRQQVSNNPLAKCLPERARKELAVNNNST